MEADDLRAGLARHSVVLARVGKADYDDSLPALLGGLKGGRVCFVSLNKTAASVFRRLERDGFGTGNLYVVDCISRTFSFPKPAKNVLYVSSPKDFTAINIAVMDVLAKKKFDYVVFDSLSSLMVYLRPPVIAKFMKFLVSRVKGAGKKAIFTIFAEDRRALGPGASALLDAELAFEPDGA